MTDNTNKGNNLVPLTDLANQIKSGYAGGAWNGSGIKSSAAAANPAHATAVGFASAASLLGLSGSGTATFDGQVVDASSLADCWNGAYASFKSGWATTTAFLAAIGIPTRTSSVIMAHWLWACRVASPAS